MTDSYVNCPHGIPINLVCGACGDFPPKPISGVDAILVERGARYGSFEGHAAVSQAIKRAMRESRNWDTLSDVAREALEMNAHKVARILNGDPAYLDSWDDIIGYTRLVADGLRATGGAA